MPPKLLKSSAVSIFLVVSFMILALASCSTHRKNVVSQPSAPSVSSPPAYYPPADDLSPETIALLDEARSWIGTKYLYGGNNRNGVDCSGFILQVFDKALGIKLPRNSAAQGEFCSPVKNSELVVGDLVFFVTMGGNRISHVGMYIGDGKMIHASSSQGVTVSSLSSSYYVKHFHSYGRVDSYYALISKQKKSNAKKVADVKTSDAKSTAPRKPVRTVRPNETKQRDQEQLRIDLERVLDQKTDSIISDFFD